MEEDKEILQGPTESEWTGAIRFYIRGAASDISLNEAPLTALL